MTGRARGVRNAAWVLAAVVLGAPGCGGPTPITRIVLVSLDTTRADRLGCYGYEGGTSPNLDALADEAVLFEHAVSPVPTTLPAHGSVFTGLYPQDHGVRYNLVFRLGPDAVTLAELLQGAGFATAGFPAAFVVSKTFGIDQGFQTYADPPDLVESLDLAHQQQAVHNGLPATQVIDRALGWLDEHDDDPKSFLWVHLYDPHAPYAPPFPYSSKFREHPYDGEIAYADAQLGRLLERLRSSAQWERTLVVVFADHGEGLHEHRERFHANLVYETTQHVPLIVRAPGARPRRIAEPVSLVDLMPTVLDYAGLKAPAALRGHSLVGAIGGRGPEPTEVYFESLAGSLNYGWAELRGVRKEQWKLIDSDRPELFDLSGDPGEMENLADREEARLSELRAALARLAEPLGSVPSAEPAHDLVVDAETEAFLASLGYVAGGAGGSVAGAAQPRELIDLEPELLAGQRVVAERDWARLEEIARYVLGRDPSNKWGLTNLIGALEWTGRWKESEGLAAEMIRLYPDADRGYTHLARAYKAQGQVERAHGVLAQGLSQLPKSLSLRYLYLVAGFDLGLDSVCGAEVPEAATKHPRSGMIQVLVARCAARAGNPEPAIEALEKAVDLGFSAVARLTEVEDFAQIARLPEFQDIVKKESSRRAEGPAAKR